MTGSMAQKTTITRVHSFRRKLKIRRGMGREGGKRGKRNSDNKLSKNASPFKHNVSELKP